MFSVVSYCICQLELQFGFKFFGCDFVFSDEGQVYLFLVCQGLVVLQKIFGVVGMCSYVVCLCLVVMFIFLCQILLLCLVLFCYVNLEIELVMQVVILLSDLILEEVDLEVCFGSGEYFGLESWCVLIDVLMFVCSFDYLYEYGFFEGFDNVVDICCVYLICSLLVFWSIWFEVYGLQLDELCVGVQFNDFGLVLDVVVVGFGVVLMCMKLGVLWLDLGCFVCLLLCMVLLSFYYYLCWKFGMLECWECVVFVEWLMCVFV